MGVNQERSAEAGWDGGESGKGGAEIINEERKENESKTEGRESRARAAAFQLTEGKEGEKRADREFPSAGGKEVEGRHLKMDHSVNTPEERNNGDANEHLARGGFTPFDEGQKEDGE